MKDLKHLIYFEDLLQNQDNELTKQAQTFNKKSLPILQALGIA